MIVYYILMVLLYSSYTAMLINFALIIIFPFGKLAFKRYNLIKGVYPKFSMIVPAYNEEKVIERTIKRFIGTDYDDKKKELVIVDDASTDSTNTIARKYAYGVINPETGYTKINENGHKNIKLVLRNKGGMGKSFVSNEGIRYSTGEVLLFIDADSQVPPNIFRLAAEHFANPEVAGLAGNLKLEKKKNFLQGFVDFEYVTAQEVFRRSYNALGIHYILPGGCTFFRRDIVFRVDGYDHETLAEDTAITWKILMNSKASVRFDPRIKVDVDESSRLDEIWNQRIRWARGNLQVTLQYFDKVGKRKYGKFMSLYYPFWLVMIIMPLVFLANSASIYIAYFLGVNIIEISILKWVFVSYFFVIVFSGIVFGARRSWFEGLLSPGLPLLLNLFSFIFWEDGVAGMLAFFGLWKYSGLFVLVISGWLFISIPGIHLALKLYKKGHRRIGTFLTFGIFGYWAFLMVAAITAYVKQIRGEKNVWIHSSRE